ncbi:hypothetical protein K439DRAFT_1625198 [Ramaria rubella]|nr:hypothetical protein K439DRAFT_1625198 [Ramaria rubella]
MGASKLRNHSTFGPRIPRIPSAPQPPLPPVISGLSHCSHQVTALLLSKALLSSPLSFLWLQSPASAFINSLFLLNFSEFHKLIHPLQNMIIRKNVLESMSSVK